VNFSDKLTRAGSPTIAGAAPGRISGCVAYFSDHATRSPIRDRKYSCSRESERRSEHQYRFQYPVPPTSPASSNTASRSRPCGGDGEGTSRQSRPQPPRRQPFAPYYRSLFLKSTCSNRCGWRDISLVPVHHGAKRARVHGRGARCSVEVGGEEARRAVSVACGRRSQDRKTDKEYLTKRLEQGPPQYIKRAAPPVFTAKTRTRSRRTHTLITAHKTQPSFRRRRQFPKTATEGSPKCCFLPPWSAAIPSPNG
jgi:hypothetical protein